MALKPHGRPSQHTFILLCRRCGDALASPNGEHPTIELRRWLEDALLAVNTPYAVRVADVGCQEVCPAGNEITLRIVNTNDPQASVRTFTFDVRSPREELLAELVGYLNKKNAPGQPMPLQGPSESLD